MAKKVFFGEEKSSTVTRKTRVKRKRVVRKRATRRAKTAALTVPKGMVLIPVPAHMAFALGVSIGQGTLG